MEMIKKVVLDAHTMCAMRLHHCVCISIVYECETVRLPRVHSASLFSFTILPLARTVVMKSLRYAARASRNWTCYICTPQSPDHLPLTGCNVSVAVSLKWAARCEGSFPSRIPWDIPYRCTHTFSRAARCPILADCPALVGAWQHFFDAFFAAPMR